MLGDSLEKKLRGGLAGFPSKGSQDWIVSTQVGCIGDANSIHGIRTGIASPMRMPTQSRASQ